MPTLTMSGIAPLLVQAMQVLGLNQRELSEKFDISLRTANRWIGGESSPSVEQVRTLAADVFPHNPGLARLLATESGSSLEALGLVAAPAPAYAALPAVPAGPPPREFPPIPLMIDSVVLAGIDAATKNGGAATRDSVPAILRAAFVRAKGLKLTTEEVEAALTAQYGKTT
jgi:transcriptional regulator with XRE-family HTH domain